MTIDEKHVKRFWSKVAITGPDECWLWMWSVNNSGYGKFRHQLKTLASHRVAFVIAKGPIPKGMCVCHSCDRPGCCNPSHLWIGTAADNNRDRNLKGRTSHGEKHSIATKLKALRGDDNPSRKHPERLKRGDENPARCMPWILKRGEDNKKSKLVSSDIIAIREKYASGDFYKCQLAKEFGVSNGNIGRIISREIWAHIP